MRGLARFYDGLHTVLGVVTAVCIALIATLVCADVIFRDLGIMTLPWQVEVSEYAQYVATFIGAPWVLKMGGHVRVDVLLNVVSAGTARVMEVVADVIGLLASACLLGYGIRTTYLTWRDDQLQIKMLTVPEWWIYSVIIVSGLLLIVEFLRRLWLARSRERDQAAVLL